MLELYASTDKTVKAAVETPVEQLDYIADAFMKALNEVGKTKTPTESDGGVKASRRLSERDLAGYLNAGERQNKNKTAAFENGEKIILTTKEEITDYINSLGGYPHQDV